MGVADDELAIALVPQTRWDGSTRGALSTARLSGWFEKKGSGRRGRRAQEAERMPRIELEGGNGGAVEVESEGTRVDGGKDRRGRENGQREERERERMSVRS